MNEPEQREEVVFEAALRLTAHERAAYLDQTCGGDTELRRRVEVLLGAFERAGGFLKEPAMPAHARTVAASLPPTEKPGDKIGRYKLLEQIGEGGCGVVYMAEQQEPVKRRVALKVIKLGMDTKQVIARFDAERQALALMDHPNIAKVLDAGATEAGRPYFVMELVRGIKITDFCDENEVSTEGRLKLFVQVCQAIQHAHQKGIIHRDIKPSNILVTVSEPGAPGCPKVIDFGIAKATTGQHLTDKTVFTAFEQFIGTPAYMSPEQAMMTSLDIDTRTDIYALGVLLYELLTGQTPFDTKELMAAGLDAMRCIIREQEPVRPSTRLSTMLAADLSRLARTRQAEPASLGSLLRGDLDWIVMKALEKDRARRYETANGLARDVERYLVDEPVVARPPSRVYRFQKLVRRNKAVFAALGAVALILVLGVAASTWQAGRAGRAGREQSRLRAAAEEARENEARLRQSAQSEARRAEAAARDLRMSLSASDFLQGVRLIEGNNRIDALPFLARSLSGNPTNYAALTRLTTLLTYHSWIVPSVIVRHNDRVTSVAFSPDGKRFVTGSADMTARVWDAQTGQPVTGPMRHDGEVVAGRSGEMISAQFSPDGKRIVTASADKTARVWDAQTGQPLTEPLRHRDRVVTAQFSPDGRRIVTAAATGCIWDAQTGQLLIELMKRSNAALAGHEVVSAQFSPEGRRIVTASSDGTARLWDAETGQPLAGPLLHSNTVNSAQFSPDGKRIITASRDKTARVWDAQTGKPLTEPMPHDDMVKSAEFSPDGKRIVTASWDKTARVWDAQTGQPRTEPLKHGGVVSSAQFSPDGRRIVTASWDGTARLWDAETGQPLTEPLKHGNSVHSAQFSPDGIRIATASSDNTARLWDARAGQRQAEPMKLRNSKRIDNFTYVWRVGALFDPDGKRIVALSENKAAGVWDAQTGQPLSEPLKHDDFVVSAQFSPDGRRIVTTSRDRTARVWDAQTGRPVTKPMKHNGEVLSARFSPDGTRIVTASSDWTARVWDAQTGQPQTEPMKHGNDVFSAQFSADGKQIVTASADRTARVWDARTARPLSEPIKHGDWVVRAEFSPDGKRIVTASWDKTARIWDPQTGQPVGEPMKHGDSVVSAQFSPDGKRIVTASADRTARIWDAQTGQPLTEPMPHSEVVNSAQFSPNGNQILTTSFDNTVRVWDAHTGQPLSEPLKQDDGVLSAEFSPDGKRIVTFSLDRTVRVWDLGPTGGKCPDWLLQLSEAISGQVLNNQGVLEQTRLDRGETLNQIRQRLAQAKDDDDGWVLWGRWFLADPATRTVSPFSKVTVPDYIENQGKEQTREALDGHDREGP